MKTFSDAFESNQDRLAYAFNGYLDTAECGEFVAKLMVRMVESESTFVRALPLESGLHIRALDLSYLLTAPPEKTELIATLADRMNGYSPRVA